jgi:hypothetical protein
VGTRVTIASKASQAWLVEENDYGDPMVQHRHPTGDVVAYVLLGRNGGSYAQCSDCGARHQLPSASTSVVDEALSPGTSPPITA